MMQISTTKIPCIRQCFLNEEDICLGCFRTFDEMRKWCKASEKEKAKMLELAKERQTAIISNEK